MSQAESEQGGIWASLRALLSDPAPGGSSKAAFAELWFELGGRPGQLTITMAKWAAGLGCQPRAATGWIRHLVGLGLIEVLERDKQRGTYTLYVFHPNPSRRAERPDPQLRLPLVTAETSEVSAAETAEVSGAGTAEVSAAETSDPQFDIAAGEGENGESMRGGSEVCAPKPPRPFNDTKNDSYKPPVLQRVFNVNEDNEGLPIGQDVAAAVAQMLDDARVDPRRWKLNLEAEVLKTVPGLNNRESRYVAGRAADLVVYYDRPKTELMGLLEIIEATRNSPGGFKKSDAAMFHAMARRWSESKGIDWDSITPKPRSGMQNAEG